MIPKILNPASFKKRCLFALLIGGTMAFSMPPFGFWPLLFVGLSLFYILLSPLSGWRGFILSWLFGFGYFVAGLYWIGNALLVPDNDFKWAWPLAVLGLPFMLAFFTGLAGRAAVALAGFKNWYGYAGFVFCLMVSEWLRGTILTGFPWNLYAYGWAGILPLVQPVSFIGTYGLTLATIAICTLPGFLYVAGKNRRTNLTACCLAALVLSCLYLWGATRLNHNPPQTGSNITLRIVQPNIAQQDKNRHDKLVENLQKTVSLSSAPFEDDHIYAIIWPETAISDYVIADQNAADYIRNAIFPAQNTFNQNQGYLLSGVLRHEITANGTPLYYNSLVAYDSQLAPQAIYDKSHLVPFGEYIPYQEHIPLRPIVQFSGFTAGQGIATQSLPDLPSFSGLVCYEVLFPGRAAPSAPRPHWIVNATNDGWYGDSAGPYQHLTQTIFRAVEEGLPLARSANTGISALIDPYGRILKKLGYNEEGFIDAALPQRTQLPTPYSRYREVPLLITLCCIGAFAILGRRKLLSTKSN